MIDQYAELALDGQDAASILPPVRNHLEGCWDCREVFEVLVRVLEVSNEIET